MTNQNEAKNATHFTCKFAGSAIIIYVNYGSHNRRSSVAASSEHEQQQQQQNINILNDADNWNWNGEPTDLRMHTPSHANTQKLPADYFFCKIKRPDPKTNRSGHLQETFFFNPYDSQHCRCQLCAY